MLPFARRPRTCAYTRVASASGTTTRRPVGLRRGGRALLGHRVKRPRNDTVIGRACLAGPRVADTVRRLRVAVVAPEIFVEL